GAGQTFVSWSDQGGRSHAITTPSSDTTYTAIFTPNYARPRGATNTRVPQVPDYRPCNNPNSTHGGGLSFGSCLTPKPKSNYLTLGTGDSNGLSTQSVGYVRFHAVLGDSGT